MNYYYYCCCFYWNIETSKYQKELKNMKNVNKQIFNCLIKICCIGYYYFLFAYKHTFRENTSFGKSIIQKILGKTAKNSKQKVKLNILIMPWYDRVLLNDIYAINCYNLLPTRILPYQINVWNNKCEAEKKFKWKSLYKFTLKLYDDNNICTLMKFILNITLSRIKSKGNI